MPPETSSCIWLLETPCQVLPLGSCNLLCSQMQLADCCFSGCIACKAHDALEGRLSGPQVEAEAVGLLTDEQTAKGGVGLGKEGRGYAPEGRLTRYGYSLWSELVLQ